MFKRVLVANRGEIAVRIVRTLRRLGVESVMVASIPDRASLAVRTADDWVLLEGHAATDTYLDHDAVIAAAKEKACDAIHPGYGFLAENAAFAERCALEGIAFAGPSATVLTSIGDKATARRFAVDAGVPVVPGYDGPDDDAILEAEARAIGFPLIVKARAGGGGRGMRVVHDPAALGEAIASARREAAAAFGDGSLLLEKLIEPAHHVEVQVVGDVMGNLLHLGERDCSVQRRHQKVIEEAPSPVVDDPLRDRITSAALSIARSVGYTNAGTFEFLVGPSGDDGSRPFWFIEANPRIQVEHPVTEAITGLDLVELQLRVAAGEPLPLRQDDIQFNGSAVEVRLYAEDPSAGFEPQAGRLQWMRFPGAAVRVDTGYEPGDDVPAHYDAMIAKLVVHAHSRPAAVEAARRALRETSVRGLPVNLDLCRAILDAPAFAQGNVTVDWLDHAVEGLISASSTPPEAWFAAAASAGVAGPWIGAGPRYVWLTDGATSRDFAVTRREHGRATVSSGGDEAAVSVSMDAMGAAFRVTLPGAASASVTSAGALLHCSIADRGYGFSLIPPPPLPRRAVAVQAGATAISAPLTGTVIAVHVAEGDNVEAARLLVTLEAMKMEHRIVASAAGTVVAVAATPGAHVTAGQILVEVR